MKRTLILVAVLAVLGTAGLFAAGGTETAAGPAVKVNPPPTMPIVNEKITLKGFGRLDPQHGPWDKMTLWIDLEALTNVHVAWETPGQDNVNERKNLILASGDLPDFFIKSGVVGEADMVKYGADGAFLALEGYIDKWAPNLKGIFQQYPEARQAVTAPDGHIYGLPRLSDFVPQRVGRYPLLNMTWIKRLNIPVPKTTDEFLVMLRRFRDEDANGNGDKTDEIPFTAHDQYFAMRGLGGQFGLRYDLSYDHRYPIMIQQGKLRIMLADPEFRDAMRVFARLFSEKLMDQEIFTQTNKDYFAKGAAGRVGFTPLYQPRNFAKFANEYDAIVPPKGPKGHQAWNYDSPFVQNTDTLIMTRANSHREATMRWFDWFYSREGSITSYMVKEGVFYTRQPDGTLRYKPEVIEAPIGFEKFIGAHTIFPGGGAPGFFRELELAPAMMGTPMLSYIKVVGPYLNKSVRPGIRSADAVQREKQLRADLDVYITENMAKFAAGQLDINNDAAWDSWVKTLDKLGLRELEKILQESISR